MNTTDLNNRTQAQAPENSSAAVNETPDDPHRLARVFLETACTHPEGRTLHYHRGDALRWDGNQYQRIGVAEMNATLTAAVKAEFDRLNVNELRAWVPSGHNKPPACRKVTTHLVANVANALRSLAALPTSTPIPSWIGSAEVPAELVLPVANGLLDASNPDAPILMAATPRFLSVNALPVRFDANAPRPEKWCRFLNELWGSDPQSADLLQEMFGMLLFLVTKYQKSFILYGPPRAGKGVIASVLRNLIGNHNVTGTTLADLSGRFGLEPLLDRSLAIISDCRLTSRSDVATIVERLLSLSGEDAVLIERKNRLAMTAKLETRFLILTNELPTLADASRALANRFMILRMVNSFLGRENPNLTDELLTELPGILNWSLEGYSRLTKRGYFVQPESAREMIEALEELASPVTSFVADACEVGPKCEVSPAAIFTAWKEWCHDRSHPIGSQSVFGRDLNAAFPKIQMGRQPVNAEGKRPTIYRGIGLRRTDP